ncbi:glycosyltransferase [Glaesserella parasuis]|nr:glycosyltransferase [Glaesserella parasuis]
MFVGHTNQPEYYYQMADFVLSMSNSEGYPMSILEAASCGCYALLSDISPHREFINKYPENSCLIYEYNSESIYKKKASIDPFSLSAKKMAIEYMTYYKS